MTKTITKALAVSGASLIAVSTMQASAILSLYNTGVDNTGVVIADGATDTHYTPSSTAVTSAGGFPVGPWLGDDALSTWISVGGHGSSPSGPILYTTTFDLTGFDPTTASITGQWATDDGGTDIILNGVSTGQTSFGFSSWAPFSLPVGSAFVAGLNTLTFIADNSGGPGGARVEMTGDATVAPEPGTMALGVMSGLGLLGLRRRRHA